MKTIIFLTAMILGISQTQASWNFLQESLEQKEDRLMGSMKMMEEEYQLSLNLIRAANFGPSVREYFAQIMTGEIADESNPARIHELIATRDQISEGSDADVMRDFFDPQHGIIYFEQREYQSYLMNLDLTYSDMCDVRAKLIQFPLFTGASKGNSYFLKLKKFILKSSGFIQRACLVREDYRALEQQLSAVRAGIQSQTKK